MELTILGVFFALCGLIVGGSPDVTSGNTTVTSSILPSSVSSAVSTAESGTTPVSTVQSTKATTSPPLPCQHERWLVPFDGERRFCIIMQADISVTIWAKNKTIPIAQNATSSGSCGVEGFATQILNITDGDVRLDWTFDKNGDKFNVTNIAITYNQSVAANIDLNGSWLSNLDQTRMYQCNAEKMVNGTAGASFITMTVRNLRLEAFHNTTSPCEFDSKYDICEDDVTVSNLVPIIVGACLGGLIVIVLIAYLVGRRRSRRGYESV